jgi:hypothetical protein
MIDLHKVVRRRSVTPFGHYRRRIVVSLEPGDVVAMRLERTRTVYRASFAQVFRQLAEWYAQAEKLRKRAERRK